MLATGRTESLIKVESHMKNSDRKSYFTLRNRPTATGAFTATQQLKYKLMPNISTDSWLGGSLKAKGPGLLKSQIAEIFLNQIRLGSLVKTS